MNVAWAGDLPEVTSELRPEGSIRRALGWAGETGDQVSGQASAKAWRRGRHKSGGGGQGKVGVTRGDLIRGCRCWQGLMPSWVP